MGNIIMMLHNITFCTAGRPDKIARSGTHREQSGHKDMCMSSRLPPSEKSL